MKIKHLSTLFIILIFSTFSLQSCKKCKKENPRARVFNQSSKVVSVQVKTSGGNTENLNNIPPNTSSEYRSYSSGIVKFTINIDKKDITVEVAMGKCFEYNILIDANENVVSQPTDRND
jgi:hypothetical protein